MNRLSTRLILFSALLGMAVGMTHAQRSDILPPQRRVEVVDQAGLLVEPPAQAELDLSLNNPFYPNSRKPQLAPPVAPTTSNEAPVTVAPASVYELLETIAPQINPTGAMSLGGNPLLLFGQKKIQVGDELPIIYDGERYTLIISRIESTSFTLRLGAAQVTRPIKSNPSP